MCVSVCGSQRTACGIQNKAQVIRFGGQCLHLLSYLAGSKPLIFSTYDVLFRALLYYKWRRIYFVTAGAGDRGRGRLLGGSPTVGLRLEGMEKKDQHSPPRKEQGLRPPLKVLMPFYYLSILCVHACLHVHAHHGTPVEGRGQLAGVGSILLCYV